MKKFLMIFTIVLFALCLASCACKEHIYGDWEVVTSATCLESGEDIHTCEKCDFAETRVTDATGHTFGEWTATTPATCLDNGEEIHVCSSCQHTETRVVEAVGHIYEETEEYSFPLLTATCNQQGIICYYCKVCKHADSVKEVKIGYADHNWTQATCTSPSYCKWCNKIGSPKLEHNWEQYEYMCSSCGLVRGMGKG